MLKMYHNMWGCFISKLFVRVLAFEKPLYLNHSSGMIMKAT